MIVEMAALARFERVRALAEKMYIAAASSGSEVFATADTDDEIASFAFEVAEAFEREAERRQP